MENFRSSRRAMADSSVPVTGYIHSDAVMQQFHLKKCIRVSGGFVGFHPMIDCPDILHPMIGGG
jgi:hypothetical protein